MSHLRRTVFILLIACSMLVMAPPRAEAFLDPVTIAILAPIAIKVAQYMKPYVVRGLASGFSALCQCGVDLLKFFLLPWGLIECTLGIPFGGFGPGVGNIVEGGASLFIFIGHVLLLPVSFLGINF